MESTFSNGQGEKSNRDMHFLEKEIDSNLVSVPTIYPSGAAAASAGGGEGSSSVFTGSDGIVSAFYHKIKHSLKPLSLPSSANF